MPNTIAARPAVAAWLLLATPALGQTSSPPGNPPANPPANPQGAPSGSGIANGNPQQEVVAAPEAGLDLTYGGEIDSKVQIDARFNRTRSGFAELYGKSVGAAYVNLGNAVSIRAEGTYERFRNQSATTAFNSEGLYLSQLYGTYTFGPVTAYAGKIHPRFSVGYDQVPGIYDTFANEYEQKERIGFGALANILPAYGRHIVSAEAYYLDNSVLSRALFANPGPDDPAVTRPGRLRTRFGGAGNTGRPDSFDVVLDGSRIPELEELRYHIGVSRQAAPTGAQVAAQTDPEADARPAAAAGGRAELGVTAALSDEWKLTPRVAMTPFIEYAHFDNFGGARGERRDYVIGAVEFDYRKYALSFTAAPRRVAAPGIATRWDVQYGSTLSYTIMPRLVVSAGYLRTRDEGQLENVFGSAIDYVLRF